MDELPILAELIKKRNALEREITTLTGRPAAIGHIGEYIASRIFDIALEQSAVQKAIDGRFRSGLLQGRSVNVKWYALQEGLLDVTPDPILDYYLVLTGPKSDAISSRGKSRPWLINNVYLFQAQLLTDELNRRGVMIGVATSVRQGLWTAAQIYPTSNGALTLSEEQRAALALFGSQRSPDVE